MTVVKPFICLQSDFGLHWGSVSSMHGVIASIDREVQVRDISHILPLYKPWAASFCLHYTVPCWPSGTIFVSIVDPGVGTARRPCAARTKTGYIIITPDNGTLTHIAVTAGIESVREIDTTRHRRPGSQQFETFHGRDVFAWTAGLLASGRISFEDIGASYPVEEIVTLPMPPPRIERGHAAGFLQGADRHFGCITTNIAISDFEKTGITHGAALSMKIMHESRPFFDGTIRYEKTFGYVGIGEPVLYNGSTGYIMAALNQKSFAESYNIEAGPDWTITLETAR
jgi:S-adenosylmethionine hydrolase